MSSKHTRMSIDTTDGQKVNSILAAETSYEYVVGGHSVNSKDSKHSRNLKANNAVTKDGIGQKSTSH